MSDAVVVVSPEHGRVFREAGWSKAQLRQRLIELGTKPLGEIAAGARGCAEGMSMSVAGMLGALGPVDPGGGGGGAPTDPAAVPVPKFLPEGLLIVHAGGSAGLFSAVIGGWARGAIGSQPVTREVL